MPDEDARLCDGTGGDGTGSRSVEEKCEGEDFISPLANAELNVVTSALSPLAQLEPSSWWELSL